MSVTVSRPQNSPTGSGRALAAARLTRSALDNIVLVGVVVLAALAPAALHQYQLVVLMSVLIYAIALFSLVVLTGYVGQVSLCQASFMGLGAYLTAAIMGHYQASYWIAAPIAVILVFLIGVGVGLPALRLKGLTLAIVTLSLALLADYFLFADVGWLNNNTLGWNLKAPHLFGTPLDNSATDHSAWLYRVILAAAVVALVAVRRLRNGRTGKSWFAMRDAEIAASTSGVPVVRMKLLAFGIAAALAAVAGALYALEQGSVSAAPFSFAYSIQLLAIAGIAGIRSLPGSILGAAVYIALPQLLLQFPALAPLTSLLLGAGLIVQVIGAPQGIGGLIDAAETRLFRILTGARGASELSQPPSGASGGASDRATVPAVPGTPAQGGRDATV
ncbi:MAG TPA: branched-chain amino acid ABC transporter permease [Ktedonobacterales bacterium]